MDYRIPQLKQAFASHGIKVYVRDQGKSFRIIPRNNGHISADHPEAPVWLAIAAAVGLFSITGQRGGQFNGAGVLGEFIAYKPEELQRLKTC